MFWTIVHMHPPPPSPTTTPHAHTFIESVRDGGDSFGDDDLGSALFSLDFDDVAFDGEHGDSLRGVDVVPHAQITAVLRHHHVRTRYPLVGWMVGDKS